MRSLKSNSRNSMHVWRGGGFSEIIHTQPHNYMTQIAFPSAISSACMRFYGWNKFCWFTCNTSEWVMKLFIEIKFVLGSRLFLFFYYSVLNTTNSNSTSIFWAEWLWVEHLIWWDCVLWHQLDSHWRVPNY